MRHYMSFISDIFLSDYNKLPLYCLDTNFINCLNRPDFFLAGRDSYFVHAWLQRCLFKSKDFIILSNFTFFTKNLVMRSCKISCPEEMAVVHDINRARQTYIFRNILIRNRYIDFH